MTDIGCISISNVLEDTKNRGQSSATGQWYASWFIVFTELETVLVYFEDCRLWLFYSSEPTFSISLYVR